jgi:hypothetical protein
MRGACISQDRRTNRGMTNAYRVLARKHERRRSIGRLRCKWEDNIKVNLNETLIGSLSS